jgi:RNA polymerase sigma-70 factor, ECF subfamily
VRRGQPGPYQIQAAINAVHSDALTAADTGWDQILRLRERFGAGTVGTVGRAWWEWLREHVGG